MTLLSVRVTFENRFVRSVKWKGMAGEDGSCTPTDLMVQLAD